MENKLKVGYKVRIDLEKFYNDGYHFIPRWYSDESYTIVSIESDNSDMFESNEICYLDRKLPNSNSIEINLKYLSLDIKEMRKNKLENLTK